MQQAIAPKSLYKTDCLEWTKDTVAKLKARDFDHLDLENLIEEIEALGSSFRDELESRLETLLAHYLKRIYVGMPYCFNGWQNTIKEQRRRITLRIKKTPSLKAEWDEIFDDALELALCSVRDHYEPKGHQIPDTWQFDRDIDSILNTDFWDLK
jgi:hypothetical protein